MNTDRRIYLTTGIVAVAVATGITAFARWTPLEPTVGVAREPEATQRVTYRQAGEAAPRLQAIDVTM